MPRAVWLTDIHLDHASDEAIDQLVSDLQGADPDFVLVGGDIGEARNFADFLRTLGSSVSARICFVLGNHDYYRSNIVSVREQAASLSSESISWLPQCEPIVLSNDTVLIGNGGWGDARVGDIFGTEIFLNDYALIDELRTVATPGCMTDELVFKLNALGDEAATNLSSKIDAAFEMASHVYLLTHVPPYREACWYEGKTSDDNWAPHFTCKAVGDLLTTAMEQRPSKQLTVLCGHTHGEGFAQILPNLEVRTAAAEYGRPGIVDIIELPE
ncbi:MAG: metallophosphoesterase [Planctomycetaceae bacterium]